MFRQGIAATHDGATFNLAFQALTVNDAAHVVSGDHLADGSVFVEDADMGGVAVGDMRYGMGDVSAHLVGLAQVFADVFPAVEDIQVAPVEADGCRRRRFFFYRYAFQVITGMTRFFVRQTLGGKEVAPQLDGGPPGSFPGQCRLPRP